MLVNPLPGVNRRHLRDALRDVHTQVFNLRGGGVPDRYFAYLRWANNSVRALGKQISAADVDRLILTRRYWVLQSLLSNFSSSDDLLNLELDERVMALDEACQTLDQQISLWSSRGEFVVADTSVYIQHLHKIEETDLSSLLGVRGEPIHLLVPIIVADELDGLKHAKDKHIRWRAAYTLGFRQAICGLYRGARSPSGCRLLGAKRWWHTARGSDGRVGF
jgi:hypothetical protein